jgi:short-subunit dehydrogenase
VAFRFGREGFRVALVARREQPLLALVAELEAEGIEAAAFPADLAELDRLPGVVDAITDRFGGIDVLEYAPSSVTWAASMIPSDKLAVTDLDRPLDLLLRAPVALTSRILPAMLERGAGALLYGGAVSTVPYAAVGNFGPAMAGVRYYALSLNAALTGTGVFAGSLVVGALVQGSAGQRDFDSAPEKYGVTDPERIDPADMADAYWEMSVRQDRPEVIFGQA